MKIKVSELNAYIMGVLKCDTATASRVAERLWLGGQIEMEDDEAPIENDSIMMLDDGVDLSAFIPTATK